MANTTADAVLDAFESSFMDKQVLPESLEMVWLEKAVGRYSLELSPLNYDSEIRSFDRKLPQYVVNTLATFMKQYYVERQLSKANKVARIVAKDISFDGNDGIKRYTEDELNYVASDARELVDHQKPSAYV